MDTALGGAGAFCVLGLLVGDRSGKGQRSAVLPVPQPGQLQSPDCEPLESPRRQTPRAHSATALWVGFLETSVIKSLKVGIIVRLQMEKLEAYPFEIS